ncbi:MAG: hypothetical protein ACO222_06125 [Polynucleobacter sp.]
MSTKAKAITSVKDAAYQSATAAERMSTIAQFIITQCPTFLDEVPAEIKTELHAGWAVRWQELNPAQQYSADWVPVEKGGMHDATLAFALSYSQQAFGQLKNEDPLRHAVIKSLRDAFSKYCHNRMADLKTAIRRLNPESRTRTATDDFGTWVNKALDNIITRCRNASARGDDTAQEVKVRMAVDAFKKTLAK